MVGYSHHKLKGNIKMNIYELRNKHLEQNPGSHFFDSEGNERGRKANAHLGTI